MLNILKNHLDKQLICIPSGTETIRLFRDNQKWISSNSKMSMYNQKNASLERENHIDIDSFYLLKYPVTIDLYNFILGQNDIISDSAVPVVNVSWDDAVLFCNTLSIKLGLNPCYYFDEQTKQTQYNKNNNGFRLPTEAEWQHACRAGSSKYQYGNIDDIAWYKDNSNESIHKVGEKTPNQWGVYDMLGNVWEWCWDLYDEKCYASYRTFRGGSWAETSQKCGVTCRRKSHPSFTIDDLGFRIAKSNI